MFLMKTKHLLFHLINGNHYLYSEVQSISQFPTVCQIRVTGKRQGILKQDVC